MGRWVTYPTNVVHYIVETFSGCGALLFMDGWMDGWMDGVL